MRIEIIFHLIALSDAHFYGDFINHTPHSDRPRGHCRRVRGRARGVAGARDQGRLLGRLHAHAHQPRQEEVGITHDDGDDEKE